MQQRISLAIRLGAFAALFGLASIAPAQVFTPSNVIVERIGDGATALNGNAFAVFIDEYNSLVPGAAVSTTPLPTAPAGSNLALTDSGSATSNGYLARSVNGLALLVPGYNAAPGTTGVANSSPATTNRTIGLVSSPVAASINTSNAFNNGPSGNFRSVASLDGSSVYASTNAGVFLKTINGTVEAATAITTVNTRNLQIAGNSLFFSSMSGAFVGINLAGTVGTLPTGSVTTTLLPGTATSGTGTPSPYGFVLFDNPLNANNYLGTGLDTLYVADDRTNANGGGIQRWVFDGTNWVLGGTATAQYTVGAAPAGFRGLTASLTGNTVNLFATSVTSATVGSNDLVALTDVLTASSGTFGGFTTLATSGTNMIFRGVDFTPVPEPGSLALCGLAVVAAARQLRRKKV